jgi:hypothetical protein
MTNEAPRTEFYDIVMDGYLLWPSLLAWLTIPLLVLWTLWTVSLWLVRKEQRRDPTPVVSGCFIQFALFLLLGTNIDLYLTFGSVHIAKPDTSLLFLMVAQILLGVFASGLTGVICASVACGVARRLPRMPWHTVFPVLIALADTFLSGCWMFWMFTLKR